MAVAAGEMRKPHAAVERLRAAAAGDPKRPQIWRMLADHLDEAGDRDGAASAYLKHIQHAIHDPELMAAGAALHANRIPEAEMRLRNQLSRRRPMSSPSACSRNWRCGSTAAKTPNVSRTLP